MRAICDVCGSEFEPTRQNQLRCSRRCRLRALAERKKVRAVRLGPYTRTCSVCGDDFAADRKNANTCQKPECRAQRKRDLASSLARGRPTSGGSSRTCVVCEEPFTGHPNALTCSRTCRLARIREQDRRRLGLGRYWCVVCGTEITDLGPSGRERYTCSKECRRRAALNRCRRTYAAHPEYREKMVETKRRRKEADLEYLARCRQWDADRAARKAAVRLRVITTKLEGMRDDTATSQTA